MSISGSSRNQHDATTNGNNNNTPRQNHAGSLSIRSSSGVISRFSPFMPRVMLGVSRESQLAAAAWLESTGGTMERTPTPSKTLSIVLPHPKEPAPAQDKFIGTFFICPKKECMLIKVGNNFRKKIPMNMEMDRALNLYLTSINKLKMRNEEDAEVILGHQLIFFDEDDRKSFCAEQKLSTGDIKLLKNCQSMLGGVLFFYIKWKGYCNKHNSWEPITHTNYDLKVKRQEDMLFGAYQGMLKLFFQSRGPADDLPPLYRKILNWISVQVV